MSHESLVNQDGRSIVNGATVPRLLALSRRVVRYIGDIPLIAFAVSFVALSISACLADWFRGRIRPRRHRGDDGPRGAQEQRRSQALRRDPEVQDRGAAEPFTIFPKSSRNPRHAKSLVLRTRRRHPLRRRLCGNACGGEPPQEPVCKRRPDRAPDEAEFQASFGYAVEVGVIAGPCRIPMCTTHSS